MVQTMGRDMVVTRDELKLSNTDLNAAKQAAEIAAKQTSQ